MPEPVGIALFGAAGRMGREILRLGPQFAGVSLLHAYDIRATGELIEGRKVEPLPRELRSDTQVVIDFSLAGAVTGHADLAGQRRAAYLSGVTGLSEEIQRHLREVAREIPVLWSPNLSVGMNLLFALAATATRALPGYRRQIIETHHTQKQDAPSGTALRLADAIREAVGEPTDITALRMGDVVGEHRLILGGPGERLELIHRADSRAVFAAGALQAAQWLAAQQPGYYTMRDFLAL